MSRRLLLIQPSAKQMRWFYPESSMALMQPLWAGVLAACTPAGWQVSFIDEGVERFEPTPADLVGITALSVQAERAYELAGHYRRRGVPVVMGGCHVSALPEEAEQYCNSVVIGEAEDIWPRVVRDFEVGRMAQRYTSHAARVGSLRLVVDHRIFQQPYAAGSIQFSRGCLGNCDFCAIPAVTGRGLRHRDAGEVLDEIESLPQRLVYIVDENFTGLGRRQHARAIELLRGWCERRIRKRWFGEGSVDLVDDPELLHWLQRSGCLMLLVGFEGLSDGELRAVNKNQNRRANYRRVVEALHAHGIAVQASFIVGLPGQTIEEVRRIMDFCVEAGVDYPFLGSAALLPGSRWWERYAPHARRRRFPADYANLAGSVMPCMPGSAITTEQWKELYAEAANRLQSPTQIMRRTARWIARKDLDIAYTMLGMNIGLRRTYERLARFDSAIEPETGRFLRKSPLAPLPPAMPVSSPHPLNMASR